MPRIIACHMCHTVERVIDPPKDVRLVPATIQWDDMGVIRSHTIQDDQGMNVMVPEFDPILEDYVARHSHGRPDTEVISFIQAFPCDQATWEKLDVVTEMKKELQLATGEFYEESQYYKEEALKCYNEHKNPQLGCPDWRDDNKTLGSKDMPKKYRTYLCDVCPVSQTYIQTEIRRKAGMYKPS